MSKVIERKNFIILFVALCMVFIPLIAEAGGGGMKKGGMGGMSGMSGGNTNYSNYNYTNRGGSYLTSYPGYSYGTPRYSYGTPGYNYSVPRYNSVLTPTIGTSPYNYNWGSQYSLGGGLNSYGYGSGVIPVTTKDYTVEKSYTQYTPGGAVTTTFGEITDNDYISVGSPYSNNYGWGAGLLGNSYNYGLNSYGLGNYGLGVSSPYNYGYDYNRSSWPYY